MPYKESQMDEVANTVLSGTEMNETAPACIELTGSLDCSQSTCTSLLKQRFKDCAINAVLDSHQRNHDQIPINLNPRLMDQNRLVAQATKYSKTFSLFSTLNSCTSDDIEEKCPSPSWVPGAPHSHERF